MIECDPLLRELFDDASKRFQARAPGRDCWDFFIDGVSFQGAWLGLMHPQEAADYLRALADTLVTYDHAADERARMTLAARRTDLMDVLARPERQAS